jgi:dual-specificity kinase
LFQTHDNLEHLAMMEMVMGKMPDRFARSGARSKPEYFKEGNRLDFPKPKASRQSKKDVRATRSLQVCPLEPIYACLLLNNTNSQEVIPPTDIYNRNFLNLVQRLLAFDPNQRITVKDALNHPYFSLNIPEET